MVHWLSKKYILLILSLFFGGYIYSQDEGVLPPVYKEYKDPEQFEKFRKRRLVVGAWQINTLREKGALVVKLKTNKMLIDQLIKKGNTRLALEKQLEQFAINKNTMFAYKDNFMFCKVYFIYSNSSDSLLNGTRQGIFLDSTLSVDPTIIMKEDFYLVAERDYVYTSSIGFVKEDSARTIKEAGNPIKSMAIVLKNKYGHQLKSPFPYCVNEKGFTTEGYDFPITFSPSSNGGITISYSINKTYLEDLKTKSVPKRTITKKNEDLETTNVKLKKQFTYEKISLAVTELNEELEQYYKKNPMPNMSRITADIKPFLY